MIIMMLTCLTVGPILTQPADQAALVSALDAYIEQARQQWEVPGLAVAVVKDGQSLLLKGYGERALYSGEPVDTNTLFAICSTTKAMTAAAMAMLIGEGKATWDDPVSAYLPQFQLEDPYVTRGLRIRDLFTHNAGVPNADLLWYMWKYEPDEILQRMRYLDLAYPLRGGYTYQNIMYAVAGALIQKLSGMSWEDFVQQHLFDPIGMDHTFPTQLSSIRYTNRAVPHHRIQDSIVAIPDGDADPIAPAGAVWSTVADMQRWMLFVLDSARVEGDRLLYPRHYAEWLKPQAMVSDAGFYPTQKLTRPHWKTYALGWFQHDYQGRMVSFHTGSLQGTVAIIGLIPDEKLGVYVFGNLDHAEVRHAIMYKVFDLFGPADLGRDWSTELLNLYQNRTPRMQDRDTLQLPSAFAQEAFAGLYVNEFLGTISISVDQNQLKGEAGAVPLKLDHRSLHTFSISYPEHPWRSAGTITFTDDGQKVTGLNMFGRTFLKQE